MSLSAEDKKKAAAAAVFAVLASGVLYFELFGGTSTPQPAPAPAVIVTTPTPKSATPGRTVTAPPGFAVDTSATKLGTTSGQLDPTLHMDAMLVTESLVYSGTGRNIFAAGPPPAPPAPPPPLKPLFTARTTTPPPPPVPNGPPPPPPINLKFFGTATTPNGNRRAFLLNGDDVFLASVGDVVQRKYRIVTISANSILVEDIPNNNKQNLPLIPN